MTGPAVTVRPNYYWLRSWLPRKTQVYLTGNSISLQAPRENNASTVYTIENNIEMITMLTHEATRGNHEAWKHHKLFIFLWQTQLFIVPLTPSTSLSLLLLSFAYFWDCLTYQDSGDAFHPSLLSPGQPFFTRGGVLDFSVWALWLLFQTGTNISCNWTLRHCSPWGKVSPYNSLLKATMMGSSRHWLTFQHTSMHDSLSMLSCDGNNIDYTFHNILLNSCMLVTSYDRS